MTEKITGNTLIGWGFEPGRWFAEAIAAANQWREAGKDDEFIRGTIRGYEPTPISTPPSDPMMDVRTNSIPFGFFVHIDAEENSQEEDDQRENALSVISHMDALMRIAPIKHGAVMPDACPSGKEEGTIPVGGVIASTEIHPGLHSADVCCSMAISVFKRDMDVSQVLDTAMKITHFGSRGRPELPHISREAQELINRFAGNRFMAGLEQFAVGQMGTQGDGNHFLYVGHLESTGQLAIVTHHGSRNVGGQLYKRGMELAQRHTSIVSPRTPKHNAWIKADSEDGRAYWEALGLTREWTGLNHFWIHDALQQALGNSIADRFWNEHNFVFQKSDGLFYHAKGATPAYGNSLSPTLIPMNMGEPILVTRPNRHAPEQALGFAPHGAGRLLSRTAHIKRLSAEFGADSRGLSPNNIAEIIRRETEGKVDARFYCGTPDVSELPSAYKNAQMVQKQIKTFGLIDVVDRVLPGGTIMAGEAPWFRKPKKVKA